MKTGFVGAFALFSFCLAVRCQDTTPLDFSKTNSVTLRLVEALRGGGPRGQGLEHLYWQGDGRTTIENVEGVACRRLNSSQGPKGYLYFQLNPSFKSHGVSKVRIDVEYFDGFAGKEGVFGLQYDASSADDATATSRQLYPNVPLKGSGKWLTTSFHVRDGTFQNSENGGADFRLWASPPELSVNHVTVRLEPLMESRAPQPTPFDKAGEAKLREWNPQWDSGTKPAFFRIGPTNDSRWLEIRGPGNQGYSAGSWRTCSWLEAGPYQFIGRIRTEGVEGGAEGASGVLLRASGQTAASGVSRVIDATTLTYDFTMPAPGFVELVCEYRGSEGSVRFDMDSLKLIRKTKARE